MKEKKSYFFIDKLILVILVVFFLFCLAQGYNGLTNNCSSYVLPGHGTTSIHFSGCGSTNKLYALFLFLIAVIVGLFINQKHKNSQKNKSKYIFLESNDIGSKSKNPDVPKWILWILSISFLLFLFLAYLLITQKI